MTSILSYYNSGSLKSAAAAAAVYWISSDEETPPISKVLLALICSVVVYALTYPFFTDPCVYYARRQYPSEAPEFRSAFDRAFNRLDEEGLIAPYVWTREDEQERFYKKVLGGICLGQAMLFLRTMNKNPHLSATEVAESIDLEEVIYVQLRNKIELEKSRKVRLFDEIENIRPTAEKGIDLSFAIPWQEKISVIYAPSIKKESKWTEYFHSIVQEGDFKGRVRFDTSLTGGHTFAFWRSGDRFSYFDAGNVYEFADSKTFCQSVRNTILLYRRSKPDQDSCMFEYEPVTVAMIP